MNSCISKEECICKKYSNTINECIDILTIRDSGKQIKLTTKPNDKAIAIVIDKCLITDENTKCDAMFLFQSSTKKVSFLIELKGFGEIEKAFKQLSFTKNNRDEYKSIIKCFTRLDTKKVKEKFIIVTNGKLDNIKKEQYENEYGIRISAILTNEATTPIPDLRDYI